MGKFTKGTANRRINYLVSENMDSQQIELSVAFLRSLSALDIVEPSKEAYSESYLSNTAYGINGSSYMDMSELQKIKPQEIQSGDVVATTAAMFTLGRSEPLLTLEEDEHYVSSSEPKLDLSHSVYQPQGSDSHGISGIPAFAEEELNAQQEVAAAAEAIQSNPNLLIGETEEFHPDSNGDTLTLSVNEEPSLASNITVSSVGETVAAEGDVLDMKITPEEGEELTSNDWTATLTEADLLETGDEEILIGDEEIHADEIIITDGIQQAAKIQEEPEILISQDKDSPESILHVTEHLFGSSEQLLSDSDGAVSSSQSEHFNSERVDGSQLYNELKDNLEPEGVEPETFVAQTESLGQEEPIYLEEEENIALSVDKSVAAEEPVAVEEPVTTEEPVTAEEPKPTSSFGLGAGLIDNTTPIALRLAEEITREPESVAGGLGAADEPDISSLKEIEDTKMVFGSNKHDDSQKVNDLAELGQTFNVEDLKKIGQRRPVVVKTSLLSLNEEPAQNSSEEANILLKVNEVRKKLEDTKSAADAIKHLA